MTKSVREQVERVRAEWVSASDVYMKAIHYPPLDVGKSEARLDDARLAAASVLNENADIFASAEETAAERDALKAEVERLRGVIEEAANALSEEAASLKSFGDYASGMPYLRVAGTLRAALQSQGGE